MPAQMLSCWLSESDAKSVFAAEESVSVAESERREIKQDFIVFYWTSLSERKWNE